MRRLKFQWVEFSPGHREAYIALDYFFEPGPLIGKNNYVLSESCCDLAEFEREADELIAELEKLKKTAKSRFQKREN
jgi:hypothetical protein